MLCGGEYYLRFGTTLVTVLLPLDKALKKSLIPWCCAGDRGSVQPMASGGVLGTALRVIGYISKALNKIKYDKMWMILQKM